MLAITHNQGALCCDKIRVASCNGDLFHTGKVVSRQVASKYRDDLTSSRICCFEPLLFVGTKSLDILNAPKSTGKLPYPLRKLCAIIGISTMAGICTGVCSCESSSL